MRFASRPTNPVVAPDLLPPHNHLLETDDLPELSAFRGLLVALSFSVLIWGVCLTAFWLLRARS